MADPARPAAALLDLDGTLVLSETVHHAAWQRFFAHWEVAVDEAEYRRHYLGRRAQDVLRELPGPWTGRDLRPSMDLLRSATLEGADAVEVVPGARELVLDLAAVGVPVAVVTSAGPQWADRVLAGVLGVRDRLATVVTGHDVTDGKPAPEGYLTACARLGVAPTGCLAAEDSAAGVRALRVAGVRDVVGLTTTAPAADLLAAGARWTLPDLRPLLTRAR